MKLLITGANGFIGKALTKELSRISHVELNLVVRNPLHIVPNSDIHYFLVEDIADQNNWKPMLDGCQVVIHAAARVHILTDNADEPLLEFRKVNVDATINLATQAANEGVKRFIFLSTIGIHGVEAFGSSISEETCYDPQTPYTQSKLEVEIALFELAKRTDMEIVIIRPPLVYAEDAPGNFGKLLKLISKKILLPLMSIKNRRSFISRDNLVDFICCCIEHPKAKNQAFVVADKEYISTPDLIKYLRQGMGLSPMIFPFPTMVMEWMCRILGKQATYNQLSCSLQINCSKAQELLNWQPKSSTIDNLRQVGANYKKLVT